MVVMMPNIRHQACEAKSWTNPDTFPILLLISAQQGMDVHIDSPTKRTFFRCQGDYSTQAGGFVVLRGSCGSRDPALVIERAGS
jgi:hypothetical protein